MNDDSWDGIPGGDLQDGIPNQDLRSYGNFVLLITKAGR